MLSGSRSSAQCPGLDSRTPQQKFANNLSGGLLTPPSSTSFSPYSRRASVTSWAAASLSGASSISYSPQQPSTPIRGRDGQDDYAMIGSLDLRDGYIDKHFATPTCSEFTHESSYPPEWLMDTSTDILSRHGFQQSFESEADHWQQSTELFHQPISSKNEAPEAITQDLPQSTPWPTLQGFQDVEIVCGLPSTNGPYPSLASSVDMASSTPFRSLLGVHQTDLMMTQNTVVPSQTFREAELDAASHMATCSELSFASFGAASNDYSSDEPNRSEQSMKSSTDDAEWVRVRREPDYVRVSRIRETSTGAKGVKKCRKTHKGGHRKNKGKSEAALIKGSKFDVSIEPEVIKAIQEMGEDGRINSNPDKKLCGHELTPGEFCDKAFTRPEHLNRHKYIHTHEKPYVCVVLECVDKDGNRKAFGRADNRQSHYVTHLKRKNGSRNTYIGFEDLCEQIRRGEAREDAEKTIKKLEKCRAQGKLEPDEPVSRSRCTV
ncbi:MAG: hypothetical protein Q9165_006659 [Trypethelium subeluteriae]